MRKIAFLTGSRGEWGYIRPILRLIEKDPELDYAIISTNMHLVPEFGMSIHEIEKDGFIVEDKIFMTYDGYNSLTMAKSLGSLLLELPTVLSRINPDILVLAGDRGEQLVGAIVALHMKIASAHIQAGELSGNVDGVVRHSITKLAHIHFAANEEFAERVRKMGEEEFRIFITGAPLVDELVEGYYTEKNELLEKYNMDKEKQIILAVQHPVTEEEEEAGDQVSETIKALSEFDAQIVLIYPNADAGSEFIRMQIQKFRKINFKIFRNLPRQDYLGFMRISKCIVGNSSSGIMEAPTFGLPCVNIGRRQNRRLKGANVINVSYNKDEIKKAIEKALSLEFQEISKKAINPYGDGKASKRIIKIIKEIEINDKLLIKEMTY